MGNCTSAKDYDEELDDNSIDYKVVNLKSQTRLKKQAY